MSLRVMVVTALIVLSAAATAQASTVGLTPIPCDETASKYMQCPDDLVVTGSPGEVNLITVSATPTLRAAGVEVTVRDTGATLSPVTDACHALSDGAVRCFVAQTGVAPGNLVVDAGDGDDTVTVDTGSWTVDGGEGDDVLRGGGAGDTLIGGPGRDDLRGGRGNDRFVDGERDAEAEHDLVDGGLGRDLVEYSFRRRGVRIVLTDVREDVSDGEDRLVGIDDAIGGSGADTIVGDGGDNRLDGAGGADRIFGRAGDDELSGGSGRGAYISAGPGDDAASGGGRIDCDHGRDRVEPDPTALVERDCEQVADAAGSVVVLLTPQRLRASAGHRVTLRLRVRLGGGTRLVGARRLSRGRPRAVRLTVLGRRLARRRGTVRVRVEVPERGEDADGSSVGPLRFSVRL